jgi:hypothetical protein
MADKKFYVVHTKKGYWVGAFIFDEQLRHAKIYTSLHYANETVKRLNYANADKYDPKIREVSICLVDEQPAADVVEVVRCKDCVWWEARTQGSWIGRCENPRNGLVSEYSENDDFCSYGERKEQT